MLLWYCGNTFGGQEPTGDTEDSDSVSERIQVGDLRVSVVNNHLPAAVSEPKVDAAHAKIARPRRNLL